MKTIDISTTQNVTIEYELAPLRDRILAFLLDLAILLFSWFLLIQVFQLVLGHFEEVGWLLAGISLMSGFLLYHIFFEIWNTGQSPGKRIMSIKVVRLDGKDPEWGDVALRAVLHMVDSLLSLGVVGILLIKTTAKSQRLGDMAANTSIIKLFSNQYQFRLEDILRISSLQNYTPVYPQVRQLTEKDMIFIKNVLSRQSKYANPAHDDVVEELVTHLMPILGVDRRPNNRIEFLKTLLKDYVVLTR
jgi:uncharacterized RDD family membrane protein YckC